MKKPSIFSKFEYELPIFMLLVLRILYQPDGLKFSLQTFAALVFCVLPAFVCGRLIRSAGGELKKILLVFTAFFAGSAVSGSMLFLNRINDVPGRAFFYSNLFFIFCVVRTFATADKPREKWIIPILCFACAAINPLFLTAYMPAIFILLLINIYTGKDPSGNKLLCAASLAAAVAGVLIFGRDMVFAENSAIPALIASNWKNIVYSLAIVAPLLPVFAVLWINVIRQSTTKTFKLIVVLIMVLPFFSLFGLVLAKPFLDPVMAYVFAQFCFFAYFTHTKNAVFIAALQKIASFFEKNPLPLLLVLVYLAAFSILRFNWKAASWIGA